MTTHLELALISKQIYFKDGGFVHGWTCREYYCDDKGFAVGAYEKNTANDMVIAFRGTDTGKVRNFIKNIITDIYILLGELPETAKEANEFVERTMESRNSLTRLWQFLKYFSSNQLYLTGHSLGGMLAQLVGFKMLNGGKDYKIVTFDNPGIGHLLDPSNLAKYGKAENHITYVVDPNLINTLKPHVGIIRHIPMKLCGSTFFSKGKYYLKNVIDGAVNDALRLILFLLLVSFFLDIFGREDLAKNVHGIANDSLGYLGRNKYIPSINIDYSDSYSALSVFITNLTYIVMYNIFSQLISNTLQQHNIDNMINHFTAGKGEPKYNEISQWPSSRQYVLSKARHVLSWANPLAHSSLLTCTNVENELRGVSFKAGKKSS